MKSVYLGLAGAGTRISEYLLEIVGGYCALDGHFNERPTESIGGLALF